MGCDPGPVSSLATRDKGTDAAPFGVGTDTGAYCYINLSFSCGTPSWAEGV